VKKGKSIVEDVCEAIYTMILFFVLSCYIKGDFFARLEDFEVISMLF
jgi:hypothetical protein